MDLFAILGATNKSKVSFVFGIIVLSKGRHWMLFTSEQLVTAHLSRPESQ